MSGIGEAGLVLGLISSTISIFQAAHEIYEAASDTSGLPRKLRMIAEQIPLVYHVLDLAKKNIEAKHVTKDALQSATSILQRCEEIATIVRKIFEKTIPAKDASKGERFRKAATFRMKSNKVKEYMEEISKSMELLAQNQVFSDAEALNAIKEGIEQLSNVPDEEEQPQFQHTGAGAINANTGAGTQENYNNSGSGKMYNAKTQHFGGTQEMGHQYNYRDQNIYIYGPPPQAEPTNIGNTVSKPPFKTCCPDEPGCTQLGELPLSLQDNIDRHPSPNYTENNSARNAHEPSHDFPDLNPKLRKIPRSLHLKVASWLEDSTQTFLWINRRPESAFSSMAEDLSAHLVHEALAKKLHLITFRSTKVPRVQFRTMIETLTSQLPLRMEEEDNTSQRLAANDPTAEQSLATFKAVVEAGSGNLYGIFYGFRWVMADTEEEQRAFRAFAEILRTYAQKWKGSKFLFVTEGNDARLRGVLRNDQVFIFQHKSATLYVKDLHYC